MLHGDSIQAMGIVSNATTGCFRDAGYDLTVGKIFVPREDEDDVARADVLDEYDIPPNGVVLLFSAETIKMPGNLCAYAMPKTSLCDDGVLVFNTGIIDPQYEGMLSGTTVNFRKTAYRIRVGDPFLRLVFDRVEVADAKQKTARAAPEVLTPQAYRNAKSLKAHHFSKTFLNLKRTVREISKQVTDEVVAKERNVLLYVIAIVALIAALPPLVTHLVPLVRSPPGVQEFKERTDSLESQLKEARERIRKLESQREQPSKAQ